MSGFAEIKIPNSAKSHKRRRWRLATKWPREPVHRHLRQSLTSSAFPGSYVYVSSNIPTLSRLGRRSCGTDSNAAINIPARNVPDQRTCHALPLSTAAANFGPASIRDMVIPTRITAVSAVSAAFDTRHTRPPADAGPRPRPCSSSAVVFWKTRDSFSFLGIISS
jgi:hypothetical protein